MNWKEEFVLQHRNVKIEKEIITQEVQNFVDDIAKEFRKENLKFDIDFDQENSIVTLPQRMIHIEFQEDTAMFRLHGVYNGILSDSCRTSQIICNGGLYRVYLGNENVNVYFVDRDLIDSIFQYLLMG